MTISEISRLRHDLRTPVNHILGYSQLLIEDEERDDSSVSWLSCIEQVASDAKQILKTIETVLPASGSATPAQDIQELRKRLDLPLHKIREVLRSIVLPADAPQSADMEKIFHATDKLMCFVTTGSLAPQQAPVRAEGPPAIAAPQAVKAHLLVVDDDLANREVMGRMLRKMDYQVSLAANGAEAVHLVHQHQYDLVLLDIVMPEMNGYDALRKIKASMPHLPVLMISAVGEMESLVQCIEMGAEDYFLKPFEPLLLRARIAAALNRARRPEPVMRERPSATGELAEMAAREIKIPLKFVINFADMAGDILLHLRQTIAPCDGTVESLLSDLAQSLAAIKKHGDRADQALKSIPGVRDGQTV
ncbi:MAG TPA: response regulator [Candidatus Limnocylindrales bacterium]|nr:response regulator [Candidatus Limnocylindrales bacterium]